ncbi:MAG: serine/threonine-protein phosphatase [Roseiflexus sp.]|nr:serine/threonine-protein phosphatase [Roseiflexus sp.]MCS7290939.1 serine/threonine-protein phosphatase [Roseiflexus sp.]MDW8145322.1 PP2C family protein-serine/threonine phosphatase [Roseiflexaceae bacterium]MDW8233519.1 PP2C family protein-serine/threonine phosphatase [Roseiflexaceae bacterium]
MLHIDIAVVKVPRHGASESGDTVEVIERPGGGLSVVLVDGQGSGRGAKTLSNLIATRAISQLKDGARDGVVARAVHDYLYTYRMGQASATLNILSIDFASGSLRVSRNNPAPFFVLSDGEVQLHNEPSTPIGLHPLARPVITEIALRPELQVVMFTDGLLKAGERYGVDMELGNYLAGWRMEADQPATALAEALLNRAMELDRNEPADDISIVVAAVIGRESAHRARRMTVSVPIERIVERHEDTFNGVDD